MKFNRNYTNRYSIDIWTKSMKMCAFVLLFVAGNTSCNKFVEIPPPASTLSDASVFTSDATAIGAITGVYAGMSLDNVGNTSNNRGIASLYLFGGLLADELTLFNIGNTTYLQFYTNNISPTTAPATFFWSQTYGQLYNLNAAVEKLNGSTSLSPAVKQQLLGEALFTRAFSYFYLVNLYGDVPLVISTDYNSNAVLGRTPKAQVWQQIIADLKQAQELLSANYLDANLLISTTERVRPTKWAATALLARAYLYYGNLTGEISNYVNAETQASLVIANTAQFSLQPLNNAFLKNNNEAIWQLQPVRSTVHPNKANTGEGAIFVLPATGPNVISNPEYPVYLSDRLLNIFEPGDQRKVSWVASVAAGANEYHYANKYKVGLVAGTPTEYSTVLRLGEQYLIRAEARAEQGNVGGAATDLNAIRTRAGLGATAAATKESLRTAILHERQVELFTEWGHRWLDLKRTGTVNAVMNVVCPEKGGVWSADWQYFPISAAEVNVGINLKQTPGYPGI
ncbi:RagB/SusD family nutrient uptake outer membrane protein [Sphingobacterium lumbrici]|uniref:RagB/SusD family nutrient uptake outer membrane protein n=1 Tax=Sphingobacterium lumbrici TaxID=2559600 RepID=UPI001128D15A|nr:RagB/SusD family nutrient uptake outer membrane protein [Sphingobacterium lumbrici]